MMGPVAGTVWETEGRWFGNCSGGGGGRGSGNGQYGGGDGDGRRFGDDSGGRNGGGSDKQWCLAVANSGVWQR